MNAAAGTEFPPIALYILLSLAVAVLSIVASFYREATAATLQKEWYHLFNSSASWGILAWLHLLGYLLWQIITPAPAYSTVHTFNQIVHLGVLSLFGHALARMGVLWAEKRHGEKIMRQGGGSGP
jgi:hypothetical protein